MNTRFKMALLLHSGESGFAIVIAVALGVIMVLVGLTMTIRSQGDQITASTQKATERSLAAAEKGITYYQAFLTSNRLLSLYPDCRTARTTPGTTCGDTRTPTAESEMSWSNASKIPGIASACSRITSVSDIESVYAGTEWKPIDSSDTTKGQFRLVSYRTVDSGDNAWPLLGELIVEGRMAQTTTNNAPKDAISRVKVNIRIGKREVENVPIPGLWIGGSSTEDSDATGGNRVQANVLINNCSLTATQMASLQTSIVGTNNSIQQTDLQMPDTPARPALQINSTANPPVAPTPGTIPLTIAAAQGNNRVSLTLPRINGAVDPATGFADQPIQFNGQSTYVYEVNSIPSGTDLTITKGQRVVIFLNGNIEDNVDIIHCGNDPISTCNPLNFQIYGKGGWGSKICLNGNRRLEAFILAPEYRVGVAGAGNNGGIKGAVWTKTWTNPDTKIDSRDCGSNTNNVVVEQTGSWNDIGLTPKYLKPPIGTIGTWERQNATN